MRLALFAIISLVAFSTSASAVTFSCEQARWAARNFSQERLEQLGKMFGVSDEDKAKARACIIAPQAKEKQ